MSVLEQAAAIALAVLPEETWEVHDDACDCTFTRIGFWTNPYLGETLEVRMCCIWAELYKLFPQFVRKTPAFRNYNTDEWEEPMLWNGEYDMPRSIWYRQLARQTGRPLPEIRAQYASQEPPKGTPRPVEPEPVQPDMFGMLVTMVMQLAEQVAELKAK